jgi:hypothetical protein
MIKAHWPLHEDLDRETSSDVAKTKSNRLPSVTVQTELNA